MIRESYSFDDLMLVPKYSDIQSRSEVDLSVSLPKGFKFLHPIAPSNMKTIMGYDLAKASIESGGLTLLHRFQPLEEQLQLVRDLKASCPNALDYLGASVGVKSEDKDAADAFVKEGLKILCVDVAHGHATNCINMCKYISHMYPDILLIAGNVATGEGAKDLWLAGADVIKCGIGQGSICSTRIQTGNGIPAMTTLIDVAEMKESLHGDLKLKDREIAFMNDGGCKASGDITKALTMCDMAMCGNIFAGCIETPGEVIDGLKSYEGSSTHKTNHIEGVKAMVHAKGHFKDILEGLLQGIRSGCSYQGSHNLQELKINPQFVKITSAGWIESNAHDVIINK